jgi:O-antigen/teichoic acid export membrane protein
MSRGVILTASRLSNFLILVFSPLLLVRILDVDSYGAYQEFVIYAMLFNLICSFGIDSSLTYFLPRYPEKVKALITQNSILILIYSAACLLTLYIFRVPFKTITSYDFVLPLAAYVFCFVNLNWLEYYWVANRRTDLVLYYSASRLIVRVSTLLLVAYLTRDVQSIIWSLVAVEAARLLIVAAGLSYTGLLSLPLDFSLTIEQIRFAGPVGLAALLQQASRNIGKLFIGAVLGPAALAYYAIASYLLPMVLVMRGAIADVVFPEMVRDRDNPDTALRLWQRTNIVFCILLLPPFVLLSYFAELFVTTLFTEQYVAAVPVFQIYMFWLLRRCFNSDVLLRARGKTLFMLTGTALSVLVNATLMVLLHRWIGLIGPAIAFIVSEVLLELYYSTLARKELDLRISELVNWREIGSVTVSCLLGFPLLFAIDQLPMPELARASAAAVTYISFCWLVAYRLGVTDIGLIVRFALSPIRKLAL